MRKFALLLLVAAFAASPAAANDKKAAAEKTDDTFAKQSANTMRIMRDGLPLILPSWSLPIFFGTHMDEKLKEGDKPAKKM